MEIDTDNLKSDQIALAAVVLRLADQIIVTPAHYLMASSNDKWLTWSNNLGSSIIATVIFIAIYLLLCNEKTKKHAAGLSILFGIWFIISGLLGVGLDSVRFLLVNPIQFLFTFGPAVLMIAAGGYHLLNENAETAQKIKSFRSERSEAYQNQNTL